MKEIEVSTEKLLKTFEGLSQRNMTSIHKSALSKGAVSVRKDIKDEIKNTFKKKDQRYKDMFRGGVQITKKRDGQSVKIHLLGSDKNYYSFILRFFAIGSEDRYVKKRNGNTLKKPAYRGVVKKTDFFSSVNYNRAYNEINNELGKRIFKRYNDGK